MPVYVLGCHVLLLQSASSVPESRLPSAKAGFVGLAYTLELAVEKVDEVEEGSGLMYADWPFGGAWKGLVPEGTDNLRPGVLLPHASRGADEDGDCIPDGNLGLPVPE
jgi:hypothetical protein